MFVVKRVAYVIFFSSAAVAAPLSADNNDTTPAGTAPAAAHVGWVPADGSRSTLGIIWACLTVFVICSWRCTHLNLPRPAETEAGWHHLFGWLPYFPKGPLRHKWGRKLGWMILISLAPEVVVALATDQYIRARTDLKELPGDRKYTMAHAFFARMGGLELVVTNTGQETEGNANEKPSEAAAPYRTVTLTLRGLGMLPALL